MGRVYTTCAARTVMKTSKSVVATRMRAKTDSSPHGSASEPCHTTTTTQQKHHDERRSMIDVPHAASTLRKSLSSLALRLAYRVYGSSPSFPPLLQVWMYGQPLPPYLLDQLEELGHRAALGLDERCDRHTGQDTVSSSAVSDTTCLPTHRPAG